VCALLVAVAIAKPAAQEEMVVRDDLDRHVELAAPAQRIVATSPGNTELVLALGLAEKVVGVTSVTQYLSYVPRLQAQAEAIPKLGDAKGLNFEKVVSLQPDLVVLDGAQRQALARLEKLGSQREFAVYVNAPDSAEGIVENVLELGVLAGASGRAERIAGTMREQIARLREAVESLDRRRSALYVIYGPEPLWTTGGDSFLGQVIETAGLRNIFADLSGYTQVSREQVVAKNPEVIVLGPDVPMSDKEVGEHFGGNLTAVAEDRIVHLSRAQGSMLQQRQTETVRAMMALFEAAYGNTLEVPGDASSEQPSYVR
jgi:iron complex transport system substrate-binding protein